MLILSPTGSAKTIQSWEGTFSDLLGKKVHSTKGSEISIATVKLGANPQKWVYIQGGLHGNELLTSEFVEWLRRRVIDGTSPLSTLGNDVAFDFVSKVNPDSLTRNNPRNINLNRNFSILWGASAEPQGEYPFSEMETKAIRDVFKYRQYHTAIDVHGYLNWIVLPTKPLMQKTGAYGNWIELANENIDLLPGYLIKTAGQLEDGGAFEDWAFWRQGAYAICLEMKYPFRIFPWKDKDHFDSYPAYESFIYKMVKGSLKLPPRKPSNVAEVPLFPNKEKKHSH